MLMVTLHSCDLPPNVAEAVSAIRFVLPVCEPSEDMDDGGGAVNENTVPAGRLDEPLPGSATTRASSSGSKRTMAVNAEELENMEDSDAALLSWAKRLKKAFKP